MATEQRTSRTIILFETAAVQINWQTAKSMEPYKIRKNPNSKVMKTKRVFWSQ